VARAVGNRWLIAAAGVVMRIALGAVYAWSEFRIPLIKEFGWSISQVTVTFTLLIFFLGLAAVFGGLWMARVGPWTVGLTAAVLYGAGVFLASLSADKLWVLYLTYGVLAGIGLGFGDIVPVAALVKWFPDKRDDHRHRGGRLRRRRPGHRADRHPPHRVPRGARSQSRVLPR
jgi:MFS transporter, OFA family, oxalate/formate antiporter